MKKVLGTGLRYFFALIFLTTAVGKLLDNRGFAAVLAGYRLFPEGILMPLALCISMGELYLGSLLWRGRFSLRTVGVVLAVNSAYLLLALITLSRGIPVANCGCFGVFLARPLTWSTPVEDGVIVALSILFWTVTRHHALRAKASSPVLARLA